MGKTPRMTTKNSACSEGTGPSLGSSSDLDKTPLREFSQWFCSIPVVWNFHLPWNIHIYLSNAHIQEMTHQGEEDTYLPHSLFTLSPSLAVLLKTRCNMRSWHSWFVVEKCLAGKWWEVKKRVAFNYKLLLIFCFWSRDDSGWTGHPV